MSLTQLVRMKQLNIECPPRCRCEPERMSYEPTLVFQAKVDCSNMSLTELPISLPHGTTTLNVSKNNVNIDLSRSFQKKTKSNFGIFLDHKLECAQ